MHGDADRSDLASSISSSTATGTVYSPAKIASFSTFTTDVAAAACASANDTFGAGQVGRR